jgi:hypothetical protein
MNFSVPLGSAPAIERIRPYKIGSPADVEEAWSMYNYSAPLLGEPREESMGLADGLGDLCLLSITSESSHAPCLRCRSAVAWSRGSRGVAAAMIEASLCSSIQHEHKACPRLSLSQYRSAC